MLLLLRKMKQSYFDREEFRKYMLYAVGEIMLIIVGILVALQIDNWNTERKQEESLKNYLNSITRNIRHDLLEVRSIRAARETALELSLWKRVLLSENDSYTIDDIAFASYALTEAQRILFLNINDTGYEALKSSGNLEQLQGRDIEQLLFEYYATVSRIALAEQNHNAYVRQLSLKVMTDWPDGLAQWEFNDPIALADDRFEELQPALRKLLNDTETNALFGLAESVDQLLLDYEKLERLGNVFVRMNETDTMSFDEAATAAIDSIYDPNSGAAHPVLIADGRITLHTYTLGVAASVDRRIVGRSVDMEAADQPYPFSLESVRRVGGSLHLTYEGGSEWAVIFLFVRGVSASRASLDFSAFDRLQLELKGDVGNEEVLVNIKDSTDPDDGSQTNIPLTLTDQWQTYEIDVSRFVNADLSHLHVVLAFLFFEEPQSFSIRNARYIRSKRASAAGSR